MRMDFIGTVCGFLMSVAVCVAGGPQNYGNMTQKIDGEWHVLGTTFPMWKKGDKLNPRFRYTPLGPGVWKDEVLYDKKNGKTGTIKGKDGATAC